MKVTHDGLGNHPRKWPILGLWDNRLHIQFEDNHPWYCLSTGEPPDGHHDDVEPVNRGFEAILKQE